MSGKGSSPRPFSVAQEEYAKRWDMIFGRDLDEKKKESTETTEKTKKDKKEQVQE